MDKLLLFGGTTEGRELAEFLETYQIPAHVCVATDYGESLMKETKYRKVHAGRLNQEAMAELMKQEHISLVVDATHPYAKAVSENIQGACQQMGVEYLRLQRAEEKQKKDWISVSSVSEAVAYLSHTNGNILVTTGSKELKEFTGIANYQERVYARVLSTQESINICADLGFQGSHLICMQGPFEKELNIALMKHVQAKWLVTKESGKQGGFEEKLLSARAVGAELIVISRPQTGKSEEDEEKKNLSFDEVQLRHILCERFQIETKRQISLIGIGMGHRKGMTEEALDACQNAQLLIGADRMLDTMKCLKKPCFSSYHAEEIYDYIRNHPEYEQVAILLSGDVGFYSGAQKLRKVFAKEKVQVFPGISSVVYLCAKAGVSWEDVKLQSLHGREQNLVNAVNRYEKVFALMGGTEDIGEICKKFQYYNMKNLILTVGERMSYSDERIVTGTPEELENQEFVSLCAVLIQNPHARNISVHGLPDEVFLRAKVPMTKAEVRSISISKLALTRDAIVYDVGAGTGSVSIEMALQAWNGLVYAIEKKPEAVQLLKENKKYFKTDNLTIVEGIAPNALRDLPIPTHVFIGGSSGNLGEILKMILAKNPSVRFVINAIALETVTEALECIRTMPVQNMDIVTVSAAKAREVGDYHMMMGQNPVYIISGTGREQNE